MKKLLALLLASALTFTAAAQEKKDQRFFEMRTYYAAPGKLDALLARFRNHTTKLFEKHGMENIGYWTPQENPDGKLIYILAYPDRVERDAAWQNFMTDPDWQTARAESEKDGRLVAKVESVFLKPTDFSPIAAPSPEGTEPRAIELRVYTTVEGRLPNLLARFSQHTCKLFEKHGMTNIAYWTPVEKAHGSDNTLIYLLAHKTKEAGLKSFDAFRADPDWIAAKKASEEKAGGSLTVPDGVKSTYMNATDFSKIK